ncbi:MAG: glucose 1-dehydrogenase [Planctomycetota bacterium]
MRAVVVVPSEKKVQVLEHPEPELRAPSQVKVRILDVGVCGTDREIASFQYGTPPQGSDYLVIGHESLGEVVEVGAAVDGLAVGDLVVPTVRRPCPQGCPACRVGRQDFCFTGDFTERGIGGAHGFMTELVVDEAAVLKRLDPALREVGVLVEPLTIAEKAFKQVWDVQDRLPWFDPNAAETARGLDHKAVVFGAGPVGLLGAMALVLRGFETWVYSLERPPHPKAAITEAIGAHYVSAAEHDMDALAEQVGRIDLVYEATGAVRPTFALLERLGQNGVFVLTGVPGHGKPSELDLHKLMRNMVLKNQLVLGTVNANAEAFAAAARDLAEFHRRWPAALAQVISGRHALEAAPALLEQGGDGIKQVVRIAD